MKEFHQYKENIKSDENHISPCLVSYTRQQIANFISHRVETFIRTLIRLNTQQKIEFLNQEVYF